MLIMNYRRVANIVKSEKIDMGGTLVKQSLPTNQLEQISPFLLLHHFGPTVVKPGDDPLDVGPHPHRGFEPVTFLFSGGIRHKDSRGNEGILSGGDVQWMTAGMGIIHSERASQDFLEAGGTMEGIQLWVNLPAKDKMVQPRYQDIKGSDIPEVKVDNGKVQLKLVAGSFGEQKGPAETFTPITAMMLEVATGGKVELPIPNGHNALIYILGGEIKLNDNFNYEGETMIKFRETGDGILLEGIQASRILFLTGEQIDEPLATYGPFVMNNQTQIMQAMRDYQMGKMGFYVD